MCYIRTHNPTPYKHFAAIKHRHAVPPPDHLAPRPQTLMQSDNPAAIAPSPPHVLSPPTPTATAVWQPRTQSHHQGQADVLPNSYHDHCPQTCCQIDVLVTFSPPKATNISYASVALRLQDQQIPSDPEFRLNIKKTTPSPRTNELVAFSSVSIATGVSLIITTTQLWRYPP